MDNFNVKEFPSKRAAFNFLIVDETEAIQGYDDVLARTDLTQEERIILERLRNAEIDHTKDLSCLLQGASTINVVGTDSVADGRVKEAAQNELAALDKEIQQMDIQIERYLQMESDTSDNAQRIRLSRERGVLESKRSDLYRKVKELERAGVGRVSDASVYETDKPNIKWQMHKHRNGYYYFADPKGNTYKERGVEVRFGLNAKSAAGEFFVKKLFNRNVWGWEIPRVVVD